LLNGLMNYGVSSMPISYCGGGDAGTNFGG
jgi:hypothetical protein